MKELQKRVKQREVERQNKEKYSEQPNLVLNAGTVCCGFMIFSSLILIVLCGSDRRFDSRLRDLSIRPSLGGKKIVGTLVTHKNGLLFTSNKKHKIGTWEEMAFD